jgi:hypothetical protein
MGRMFDELPAFYALRVAADAVRTRVHSIVAAVFEGAEGAPLAPLLGSVTTMAALLFLREFARSRADFLPRLRLPISVAAVVLLMRVLGLFSNSYIVAEGGTVRFMATTMTLVRASAVPIAAAAGVHAYAKVCFCARTQVLWWRSFRCKPAMRWRVAGVGALAVTIGRAAVHCTGYGVEKSGAARARTGLVARVAVIEHTRAMQTHFLLRNPCSLCLCSRRSRLWRRDGSISTGPAPAPSC